MASILLRGCKGSLSATHVSRNDARSLRALEGSDGDKGRRWFDVDKPSLSLSMIQVSDPEIALSLSSIW